MFAIPPAQAARGECVRTFTPAMARRAIRAVYGGARPVSSTARGNVARYVRCQRDLRARLRLSRELRAAVRAWRARRYPPLYGPVIASWYDDSGSTGCGFHARYGIATLNGTPCGGRVLLEHDGYRVLATRDDSGPYVAGRVFDLDPAVKAALHCGDLCSVRYR